MAGPGLGPGQGTAVELLFVVRHFIQLSHSWLLVPAGLLQGPSLVFAPNHNQMLLENVGRGAVLTSSTRYLPNSWKPSIRPHASCLASAARPWLFVLSWVAFSPSPPASGSKGRAGARSGKATCRPSGRDDAWTGRKHQPWTMERDVRRGDVPAHHPQAGTWQFDFVAFSFPV